MSKIIADSFAEGFKMWCCRLLITAKNQELADISAQTATGFGVSIIMSPAEAGLEQKLPEKTPDGRPGRIIQIWHSKKAKLQNEVLARVGQCVLTAPTTALFNATENPDHTYKLGKNLSFFGDSHQVQDTLEERTIHRVPVMDGEFVIEEEVGFVKGVAGGNLIIIGKDPIGTLEATQNAVRAIYEEAQVITSFPGGICRSGSKVGSQYKFLHASTNHKYCPTLKDKVEDSLLPPEAECVYEIVLNGLTQEDVEKAMTRGANAASSHDSVISITAANFGGNLGQYQIPVLG
ncbi:MAG: formylmethanofuran--tetrahydromethanopterin N-formyltransferase [Promethearchaeota archaeon]